MADKQQQLDRVLEIIRERARRDAEKRAALLPQDYSHRTIENDGARIYGERAAALYACAEAIEKELGR